MKRTAAQRRTLYLMRIDDEHLHHFTPHHTGPHVTHLLIGDHHNQRDNRPRWERLTRDYEALITFDHNQLHSIHTRDNHPILSDILNTLQRHPGIIRSEDVLAALEPFLSEEPDGGLTA